MQNEECRMKTPSYPPVRGRLYTFFGLRFTNCVSAIFHSSLFTLHFSLKKEEEKGNSHSSFFILHSSFRRFFIYNISYFFLTGSQESPMPSFLKILRSTSLSITVE